MATMNDWAAFFSGSYQGRIRSPESDWEDMIGTVKLVCTAGEGDGLETRITTLEFGKWTGLLRPREGIMEGSTGQGDVYFKCVFQERVQEAGIQGCFQGEICEPPGNPLFEFHLASDWRRPRPGS